MMQRVSIPAEHCLSRRAASFSGAGINRRARIIENMRIMWAIICRYSTLAKMLRRPFLLHFSKTETKLFVTLMDFVAHCTNECTMCASAQLCNWTKMSKWSKTLENLLIFCAKRYRIQLRKRLRDLKLTRKN